MTHCPICRAALNGADTCRRCRAELLTVKQAAAEGQALVGLAMHHLALDDAATAAQLLQRALALHATPAAQALRRAISQPRNNPLIEIDATARLTANTPPASS